MLALLAGRGLLLKSRSDRFLPWFKKQRELRGLCICPETSLWPSWPLLSDPSGPQNTLPHPLPASHLSVRVWLQHPPNFCVCSAPALTLGSCSRKARPSLDCSHLFHCLPLWVKHPPDKDHVCLAHRITSQVCPFFQRNGVLPSRFHVREWSRKLGHVGSGVNWRSCEHTGGCSQLKTPTAQPPAAPRSESVSKWY